MKYKINGQWVRRKEFFAKNNENDFYQKYNNEGELVYEGIYDPYAGYNGRNAEYNGRRKFCKWIVNGKPVSKCSWRWNGDEGVHRRWHKQGCKAEEFTIKDGNKQGIERSWYKDGTLHMEQVYKMGVVIRKKIWHENGQLGSESPYNDEGKRTGAHKEWDTAGSLVHSTDYKDNRANGYARRWQGEQLVQEVFCIDGNRAGLQVTWNNQGALEGVIYYHEGCSQRKLPSRLDIAMSSLPEKEKARCAEWLKDVEFIELVMEIREWKERYRNVSSAIHYKVPIRLKEKTLKDLEGRGLYHCYKEDLEEEILHIFCAKEEEVLKVIEHITFDKKLQDISSEERFILTTTTTCNAVEPCKAFLKALGYEVEEK